MGVADFPYPFRFMEKLRIFTGVTIALPVC
jgi:hypothetical protein